MSLLFIEPLVVVDVSTSTFLEGTRTSYVDYELYIPLDLNACFNDVTNSLKFQLPITDLDSEADFDKAQAWTPVSDGVLRLDGISTSGFDAQLEYADFKVQGSSNYTSLNPYMYSVNGLRPVITGDSVEDWYRNRCIVKSGIGTDRKLQSSDDFSVADATPRSTFEDILNHLFLGTTTTPSGVQVKPPVSPETRDAIQKWLVHEGIGVNSQRLANAIFDTRQSQDLMRKVLLLGKYQRNPGGFGTVELADKDIVSIPVDLRESSGNVISIRLNFVQTEHAAIPKHTGSSPTASGELNNDGNAEGTGSPPTDNGELNNDGEPEEVAEEDPPTTEAPADTDPTDTEGPEMQAIVEMDPLYTHGDTTTVHITFSEAVSVVDPTLLVHSDSTGLSSSVQVDYTNGNKTVKVTVTAEGNGAYLLVMSSDMFMNGQDKVVTGSLYSKSLGNGNDRLSTFTFPASYEEAFAQDSGQVMEIALQTPTDINNIRITRHHSYYQLLKWRLDVQLANSPESEWNEWASHESHSTNALQINTSKESAWSVKAIRVHLIAYNHVFSNSQPDGVHLKLFNGEAEIPQIIGTELSHTSALQSWRISSGQITVPGVFLNSHWWYPNRIMYKLNDAGVAAMTPLTDMASIPTYNKKWNTALFTGTSAADSLELRE